MKTIIIKGLSVLFLLSLIIACTTEKDDQKAVVIDVEQIKKEIQEKENEFAEVYNSGEMKKIGYYADDAITFAQDSPPLVGKAEIIEYLKTYIDSTNTNKISFSTNEVFVSNDAEQVVEIGYYKVVDSDGNIVNSGNYMSLFVKRNDKYVSLRDMSACDMPFE